MYLSGMKMSSVNPKLTVIPCLQEGTVNHSWEPRALQESRQLWTPLQAMHIAVYNMA